MSSEDIIQLIKQKLFNLQQKYNNTCYGDSEYYMYIYKAQINILESLINDIKKQQLSSSEENKNYNPAEILGL